MTPAEARTHESAVQTVAGALCQHYAGRFQRSTVIKVIATTAAVPANLPKRTAARLDFLMGAALWLLDYRLRYEYCEVPAQDEPVEPGETVFDSGALEEQNQALARQVKELRVALHDAERTSNRLREQLRNAKQSWEADRSELSQLRETLYRLRAEEDAEAEDSGPLVELPWQVKRRVVVYGGHDSWRKAVKPLLPGARFYDREELTDLNTVRGADVVWLQVNAMSHKYYYRIIDAARKHDIPVRYFGSASAKKCAVQLALEELAVEKSGDKV